MALENSRAIPIVRLFTRKVPRYGNWRRPTKADGSPSLACERTLLIRQEFARPDPNISEMQGLNGPKPRALAALGAGMDILVSMDGFKLPNSRARTA